MLPFQQLRGAAPVCPRPPTAASPTRPGFLAAGVASGVKRRGKLDLGLLASEVPCVSAATFTSNAAAAAPVRLTRATSDCAAPARRRRERRERQRLHRRAGPRRRGAHARAWRPALCGCRSSRSPWPPPASSACPADGRRSSRASPAPHEPSRPAAAPASPRPSAPPTSTAKGGALAVDAAGGQVRLGFAAKGCGMISPNMATMLCFVTCDARARRRGLGSRSCAAPWAPPSTASPWTARSPPTTWSSASATAPPAWHPGPKTASPFAEALEGGAARPRRGHRRRRRGHDVTR